jgi:TPP-dependent pyruvate/acetoin dehydrogenase alpha subunit
MKPVSPPARLEELETQAKQEVDEAVAWALESPRPEPGLEVDGVYAASNWNTDGRLS